MTPTARGLAVLLCAAACSAHAQGDLLTSSALRLYGEGNQRSSDGPLAQANQLSPSIAPAQKWSAVAEADFAARWKALTAGVSLQSTKTESGTRNRFILDELFAGAEAARVHFSLGKKVASWDVGYSFRPNDLIQQEPRRVLFQHPLEGRPMVLAEHFGTDSAFTAVAYRHEPRADDKPAFALKENALAMRSYTHLGPADLYLYGQWGETTRATAGTSASWVATDSLELHGSYRKTGRYPAPVLDAAAALVASQSPYAFVQQRDRADQALLGFTWTAESKLSFIVEAIYDGTAPSDAFWSAWQSRTDALLAVAASPGPVPVTAVGGNLGWQATQLSANLLRRKNAFLRASWSHDRWQPAIDVLYSPVDRGAVATAALAWQGERIHIDVGGRAFLGPEKSLYAQTPVKRVVFLQLTAAF